MGGKPKGDLKILYIGYEERNLIMWKTRTTLEEEKKYWFQNLHRTNKRKRP